jgi:hypothetical protein
MLAWWRELNAQERTALIAAGGGWSVDAFDFMIYTLAIPALITAWGMTRPEADRHLDLLCSAGAGSRALWTGGARAVSRSDAWFAFLHVPVGLPTRSRSFWYSAACRASASAGSGRWARAWWAR